MRLGRFAATTILACACFGKPTLAQDATKAHVAQAGVNGVTVPTCAYCPTPQYTPKARAAKLQGTVVVKAVVTKEGGAQNISVVKGLGLGLDEKAVEIVKKWRFRPAHDSEGRAVSVEVPMDVTFRISN